MTVYIQQGFANNKLNVRELKNDLLTALVKAVDIVPKGTDIALYKKKNALYFISGEITPNKDGQYIRNNNNMKYRDYAVLDVEDTGKSNSELVAIFNDKLAKYSYAYYPSISHTEDNPRYRVVVELDRNANGNEYSNVITELYKLLGVNGDTSAKTFSQLQGLPICKELDKDNYKVVVNRGIKYAVKEVEKQNENLQTITASSNVKMLDDETAIALFKAYIDVDMDNLQEYNNYIAVNLTLAKAVITNEISYDVAIECSELLAQDNQDWVENNLDKLNAEIRNGKNNPNYFRSAYSFRNRMKAPIKNAKNSKVKKDLVNLWNTVYNNAVEDFKDLDLTEEAENITFKNNYELKQFLFQVGEEWRIDNEEIRKDGTIKIPIMGFTVISSILRKYIPMVLIGETEDLASVYSYDYGNGIYTNSIIHIERLISTIENRYNPKKYNEVIKHIRTKIKYVSKLENRHLIACNNGVFNLKTKQLEKFTPNYYITSKLATDYNPYAVDNYNDLYRNTFDVDKWLLEISNNDSEIYELLWQVINESINPNHTRRKLGVMLGSGKNGKGTYQALLTALIGSMYVATLKPPQFATQFQISQLIGKVCNIGDDISNKRLDEIDVIKSIVSGDPITIDRKNQSPITVALKTFLLFSANEMPKTAEKSQAFLDRLLIIPFNADFQGQKEDRSIKDVHIKNRYVLEYVLYKALHLEFEHFIEAKAVNKGLHDYTLENDSIALYIEDVYIPNEYHLVPRLPIKLITRDYVIHCNELNITPRQNIGRMFCEQLNKYMKVNTLPFRYKYKKRMLTADDANTINKINNSNFWVDSPYNSVTMIEKRDKLEKTES